jgi:hypothetical protein
MSQSTAPGADLDVGAALAQLSGALDVLTSAAWWRVADGDLAAVVVGLHRVESRVAAAQVGALSEAGSRGLPARAGAKGVAGWLRGLVPVTPGQASARAALAEALPGQGLAATRVAFAAGEVTPGHAGVLARTMTALAAIPDPVDERTFAEAQGLLLATATRVDARQLGKAGLRLRQVLDPDAPVRLARDEEAQQEAREAYLVQESTGMWLLRAVMAPLDGARVRAALDGLAAPRPAVDGAPDPRTGRQRMADALALLADLSLAARIGAPGGLPVRGGAATRLVITADLATLTARPGTPGLIPAHVQTGEPGGWPISPVTLHTLACDAEVLPILLEDHTGRPLDVGDTRYRFPARIRRAIEHRDQHCTYPGCTAPPPWCHTHHITAFNRSHQTSEDNGTLLCGRHHRHIHTHHWTARIVNGHITWQPPNPNDEPPPPNAYTQEFEQLLKQLAHRWTTRTQAAEHDTS